MPESNVAEPDFFCTNSLLEMLCFQAFDLQQTHVYETLGIKTWLARKNAYAQGHPAPLQGSHQTDARQPYSLKCVPITLKPVATDQSQEEDQQHVNYRIPLRTYGTKCTLPSFMRYNVTGPVPTSSAR